MKRKLWSYGIEDAIAGELDAFDYMIWGLAKQIPSEAVWIEENMPFRDLLTKYAMLLMEDAYEPLKK